LNTLIQTLARYASFLRWLLLDSLWRKKYLTLVILGTGFLGVAFQVKVFGLVVYYAQRFSSGEKINFAKYTFDPRTSIELLLTGSIAVVILLFLSTLCTYFSRRSTLRMGREYEEFCAKRVFCLLGKGNDVFSADEEVKGESYLYRLAKTDSRYANRVLRMMLSLVIPSITLLVAIAVLFYIKHSLTLIVTLLAGVFLFYQYRASRQAARHSKEFETLTSASARGYRTLIQHFRQQPANQTGRDMVEHLFAGGPVKKQLDSYEGRLRSVENSRLISGIFMSMILGFILLVMGMDIIHSGIGWGSLLVYLLALRFAMTNLQTVFSQITGINRFYPQVLRYFLFVQSYFPEVKSRTYPLDRYELRVTVDERDRLQGTLARSMIKVGTHLSLVTPLELNRYTMAALTRSMIGESKSIIKSALFSMRFATTKHSCPQMTLREFLCLEPDDKWSDLGIWFPDEEMWKAAQNLLPKNLDKQIKSKIWDEVPSKLKFALSLISAMRSDCRWILLEGSGLKLFSSKMVRFYLDLFPNRIVVMVFNNDFDLVGSCGDSIVAVAGEDKLVGLGSPEWFASVRGRVDHITQNGTIKKKRAKVEQEEDGLDDEI
jgi:ABC-type multidrug transport system fused ATPase/permease subunit